METAFNKIPLWVINFLSLISAILTIITTIISLFSISQNWENSYRYVFGFLLIFIFSLLIRIRKYKKILFKIQHATSFTFHKLTHISRDLYFDIMRYHKDKTENIRILTDTYRSQLSILLSLLCAMMEECCGQKTSSCIKLITSPDEKIDDIILTTFCRSNDSDTIRGLYENNNKIRLSDNTDFLYIVDPNRDSNLNYFYQGDLRSYAKELQKQNKKYKNTNTNWMDDYIGTIVVPIQIRHEHLYDTQVENSIHIIGFLCIDSKSSSAFLKRQEKINVDMMKSFADIIYVLLSQYRHYLKKMSEVKT